MIPVKFKGANFLLKTEQGELPMFRNHKGFVLTCWKLNLIERLRLLFTGNLWNLQVTKNKPVQGISFSTRKSDFFSPKEKEPEKKSHLKKVA